MKIEPTEYVWTVPEAQQAFDQLKALRDAVWDQCKKELGDDQPENATATELAKQHRIVSNPQRRAEIMASYQQVAHGYERKMSDLVMRYTSPRIFVSKADSQ